MSPPRLEEWCTTEEAAAMLGVTKQAVHKMLKNGEFKSARALGAKPIYVLGRAEVEGIALRRRAAQQAAEEPAATA